MDPYFKMKSIFLSKFRSVHPTGQTAPARAMIPSIRIFVFIERPSSGWDWDQSGGWRL